MSCLSLIAGLTVVFSSIYLLEEEKKLRTIQRNKSFTKIRLLWVVSMIATFAAAVTIGVAGSLSAARIGQSWATL